MIYQVYVLRFYLVLLDCIIACSTSNHICVSLQYTISIPLQTAMSAGLHHIQRYYLVSLSLAGCMQFNHNRATTCDFQQCGILTSVDS